MSGPQTRILSHQALYRCQHRQRCCSSGWPIEVETSQRPAIVAALADGRLTTTGGVAPLIDESPGLQRLAVQDQRCVFCDTATDRGCRIHRTLGHDALPLACRQFPRLVVVDPRGASVTLSHYCPTVAALLDTDAADTTSPIVTNPPAFPASGEYVGLSADPHLPPLLHAALAMDWESWWLCESLAVNLVLTASQPLRRLALAIEQLRTWRVGSIDLSTQVRRSFHLAMYVSDPGPIALDHAALRHAALTAVPARWRADATVALDAPPAAPLSDIARRRFLAAHLFANWTAYQGEGLRGWVGSVLAAASWLDATRDPGRTDLVLRHLADSSTLVAHWNRLEDTPLTRHP